MTNSLLGIMSLIYKMLLRNHPTFDPTIISQICVCDLLENDEWQDFVA